MTNSRWEILLDGLVKRALFWSPLRSYLLYKYRYAFTPAQLARLTMLATEAARSPGDFCEIGCYRGYTTVFLNRHLDAIAPEKRYWAVDTFGGFVAADVSHEQRTRGKNSQEDRRALDKFTINSRGWFEATLRQNGITRVRTCAAAVQDFSFPGEVLSASCSSTWIFTSQAWPPWKRSGRGWLPEAWWWWTIARRITFTTDRDRRWRSFVAGTISPSNWSRPSWPCSASPPDRNSSWRDLRRPSH
jgi:hypothetical protein